MTIIVRNQSAKPLDPKLGPLQRYVRRNADGPAYSWCLKQQRARYDYAQGDCGGEDLPADVRAAADSFRGFAFGHVPWPGDMPQQAPTIQNTPGKS